jgi:hypothetical protein
MRPRISSRFLGIASLVASAVLVAAFAPAIGTAQAATHASTASHKVRPNKVGMLDCNGFSTIQRTLKTGPCSDPIGYDGGRFYDNGHYIGHDEPIVRFLSNRPGSGNRTTWTETLPRDPAARPTVGSPGKDVTHWFELSIAPWFSMALCNPRSFPLITPCTPRSDSNAPTSTFPGGGSSFLEMQFYPPGDAPFVDSISCDNKHWCASLHINDAECDVNFNCNPACTEPTNFAFIQHNGVPTGPPSPQLANLATSTPNRQTLLMNPGDRLKIHIFDASIGGGQHALETRIDDLTTGQSGFMIASAANGFMATNPGDCSGTPFNYEPEYNTAAPANIIPWAALETNISTDFEIGHFTPCSSLEKPATLNLGGGVTDKTWQVCRGAYERAGRQAGLTEETNDAPCYPRGDTHGGLAPPNLVTGCLSFFGSPSGDVDYDGTSYWPDWPNAATPNRHPSPFLQREPTTTGGALYPRVQFQTEAPASEASCQPTGAGCAVPPPGAPGHFYPWFTLAKANGHCAWEFGQMTNGRTFGRTKQYGKPSARAFFTLESPIFPRPSC